MHKPQKPLYTAPQVSEHLICPEGVLCNSTFSKYDLTGDPNSADNGYEIIDNGSY